MHLVRFFPSHKLTANTCNIIKDNMTTNSTIHIINIVT